MENLDVKIDDTLWVYPLNEADMGPIIEFGPVKQIDEDLNGNIVVCFQDESVSEDEQVWYNTDEYDVIYYNNKENC